MFITFDKPDYTTGPTDTTPGKEQGKEERDPGFDHYTLMSHISKEPQKKSWPKYDISMCENIWGLFWV